MREIKFRAWDKKDKVMREVCGIEYLKISNHGNITKTIVEMHCYDYEEHKAFVLSVPAENIDRIELMQYTGLKDKSGKEIFEGDIIEYSTDMIDKGNKLKGYRKSEVKNNSPYSFSPWWDNCVIEPEVIGNIYEGLHSGENYENPELLNVKQ